MALRFVLDENLRGDLWDALRDHNGKGQYPVNVVRVGDPPSPALGTPDDVLLLWAEQEERILVTLDKNTMPGHLAEHLKAGHHSPGVFIVRLASNIGQMLSFLVAAAHASDRMDWQDQYFYVP